MQASIKNANLKTTTPLCKVILVELPLQCSWVNIERVTPHHEYINLGIEPEARQKAYRRLLRGRIAKKDLDEIRDCTNKAWALGDARFKVEVEAKTGIPSQSAGRGGDRKSERYRKGGNQ